MRSRLPAGSFGLVVSAVLGLALAGCAGGEPRTELTLTAANTSVGRAIFRLRCEPLGGDLPDPAAACAALARDPRLVTDPKPFTCHGGTFSWWEITIEGRLEGKDVGVETSTCWTPQMALIEALGIGGSELQEHVDPLSRPAYPGSGIPRSALADIVEIPGDAPGWLIRIARLQARWLGDPKPDRLRLVLGATHRIALWGDFAGQRSGRMARIVVDPKRRTVDTLNLDGARVTPAPTGPPSYLRGFEACQRAQRTDALPSFKRFLGPGGIGPAAKRYAERMEQIVRSHINLRRGDSFRLAYKGCLDAAWPDGIPKRAISLRELVRGDRFLFPPGVAIRRGTIFTCLSGGIRVTGPVPPAGRVHISHADGRHESATIAVRTRADGTVVASCR